MCLFSGGFTYDLDAVSIECVCFLASCCDDDDEDADDVDDDDCCVGVLRMLLMMGVVTGALTVSAGLIGLMVFFMINSSVSPANLWPMLGNLFTMLCVNDVDGRLLRDDCAATAAVREDGKSNEPNDVFSDEMAAVEPAVAAADNDAGEVNGPNDEDDNDDAVDNDDVAGVSDANADGFVRLFSNDSLPPYRDDANGPTENE